MENELLDFGDSSRQVFAREIPVELLDLIEKYLVTSKVDSPYNVYNSTYGSEFELADIPRSCVLPPELKWDGKDQTVMNTNGVATDPSLDANVRTWQFGGEVNSSTGYPLEEFVRIYKALLAAAPTATVNNSCNLHNHMRVPGMDLLALKRLIAYYYVYRDELIKWGDPIPTPEEQGITAFNHSPSHYQDAVDRYTHHTKPHGGSRHGDLPEYILKFKLEATTEEEFHAASCYAKSGEKLMKWGSTRRAGINTLQMRKSDIQGTENIPWEERAYAESGTVEFRMHHGTVDIEKYRNTLLWDTEIMNAALNTGETPESIFRRLFGEKEHRDVLPEYQHFEPFKYDIFKLTKNDGLMARRAVVNAEIARLKANGTI